MISTTSHQHPHSRTQQFYTPNTTALPQLPADNFYFYTGEGDNININASTSIPISSTYHPAPTSTYSPSKRLKLDQSFDFTALQTAVEDDCPPLIYPSTMPQPVHRPRPLAPYTNLHRPTEPVSPVTIASTLSTHSTPSPSPSRVTIVSENTPDFSLYDDGFTLQDHQLKQQAPRLRFTANTSNPPLSSFNNLDFDNSWMDLTKTHQQQYYHPHTMPSYTNGHSAFTHPRHEEELPALSPSRCTDSRHSNSERGDLPVTPIQSPVHGHRCAQAPAVRESAYIEDWMNGCLPIQLENNNPAKLDRDVSDAVQDELFNPGIAPGIAHNQLDRQSEQNTQLPALFQQAQSRHAMARSTPVKPIMMMRHHSPFRANSPFHPARTHQEILTPPTRTTAFLPVSAYTTQRSRREKDNEREAEAMREQVAKECEEFQQTPKTISPKDAYLEYHEPEGNGIRGSLFSSSSQNDDAYSQHSIKSESDSYHGSIHGEEECNQNQQNYDMTNSGRRESDNMDYTMYHGNTQQFGDHLNMPEYGWGEGHSSQESSEASRRSDPNYELTSSSLRKPEDTMANDGAYSCTVHGCTMRFPTASKMSKHRREVHRNSTPMGRDAPLKSLLQGPSRCARINPTTGKPCNTIFSRPYDLTRHEDTIHNTARQKVRCEICNDEKTFSRQDALTRHKKVKHGIDK